MFQVFILFLFVTYTNNVPLHMCNIYIKKHVTRNLTEKRYSFRLNWFRNSVIKIHIKCLLFHRNMSVRLTTSYTKLFAVVLLNNIRNMLHFDKTDFFINLRNCVIVYKSLRERWRNCLNAVTLMTVTVISLFMN